MYLKHIKTLTPINNRVKGGRSSYAFFCIYHSFCFDHTRPLCTSPRLNKRKLFYATTAIISPAEFRASLQSTDSEIFVSLKCQNWVFLLGKILFGLIRVVCTTLESPNTHKMQNPQKLSKPTK